MSQDSESRHERFLVMSANVNAIVSSNDLPQNQPEAESFLRMQVVSSMVRSYADSFAQWFTRRMVKEIHTSSYLKWMAQRSVVSGNARIGETKRQFIVDERKRRALLRKCRNKIAKQERRSDEC